ncbi:hypothetical protein GZH47_33020 (plasmid) [Paenibacillus rhizovicinus]|uniref:Uncharacterized protein n=1 Tax=Paenibacillus rhizovicinus TaxID=2704463 RepID=A0A6C0PB04_9BACL|nr:hypothetical protein [Paenibacillus rhizovicinus]QHW35717.1 hypothetical protein GZH47_33020 [Paenibacillus rhizovicinus]
MLELMRKFTDQKKAEGYTLEEITDMLMNMSIADLQATLQSVQEVQQ